MPGRPWNPLRLVVVGVVALVTAVTLVGVAVVLAFVLASDPDRATDTEVPDAPADLCAVIGGDDLAAWVPDGVPAATADDGRATCETTSGDGGTQLSARVFRYAPREDARGPAGETQAEASFDRACADAEVDDAGVGDESCLPSLSEGGTSASVVLEVRRGGDLVSVRHFGDPLTADEARERAVEVATRILAALER